MRHARVDRDVALQRAVVDGNDFEAPVRELPRPAAGRGAEIDGAHAGPQELRLPLAEEHEECLGELRGRSRRRAVRHSQARDTHRPGRTGGHAARADVGGVPVAQEHVLPQRVSGIDEPPFAQRFVDRGASARASVESALPSLVSGNSTHTPAAAALRQRGDRVDDRRDAVGAPGIRR